LERTLSNRRRYLTADELDKLIKAGRKGRYGRRDATLMLLMARHGLRVTEAIDLRWDQIDFSKGHLHVRRLKGGIILFTRSKATNCGLCVNLGASSSRNPPFRETTLFCV
jgi:integrase